MNSHSGAGAGPLLKITGLSKSFGGVQALRSVDLEVFPGQVYGLIGSNGAGKSTLIKILSGDIQRDAGDIFWQGAPLTVDNPQEAYSQGLNFIHQELGLIPKFTILQNLTLGIKKAGRFGLIDWRATRRQVRAVVEKVGIKHPLNTIVERLSVADQWLVSIAHALMHSCKLISMDEPTASLSAEESETLFNVIKDLTDEGVAVLYVSHRLDEILRFCDRISVFKDGKCVLATDRQNATKQMLIDAIVGKSLEQAAPLPQAENSGRPALLEAKNLTYSDKVRNVSFIVHKGEVLGIGGLVGSGRTELANLLFGVEQPDAGTMILAGAPYAPKDPAQAIACGIGLVPEERRSQGLILKDSIDFNISITNLRALRLAKAIPFINMAKSAAMSQSIVTRLGIKAPSIRTPIIDLSGGNQQKVVIGKWLNRNLKILILDEPSRGVDVGARAEIHKKIRELANEGMGIIVISSDNEELPLLCDRVMVMSYGCKTAMLADKEISKEAILVKSYERDGTVSASGVG